MRLSHEVEGLIEHLVRIGVRICIITITPHFKVRPFENYIIREYFMASRFDFCFSKTEKVIRDLQLQCMAKQRIIAEIAKYFLEAAQCTRATTATAHTTATKNKKSPTMTTKKNKNVMCSSSIASHTVRALPPRSPTRSRDPLLLINCFVTTVAASSSLYRVIVVVFVPRTQCTYSTKAAAVKSSHCAR